MVNERMKVNMSCPEDREVRRKGTHGSQRTSDYSLSLPCLFEGSRAPKILCSFKTLGNTPFQTVAYNLPWPPVVTTCFLLRLEKGKVAFAFGCPQDCVTQSRISNTRKETPPGRVGAESRDQQPAARTC